TGRGSIARESTIAWLKQHQIRYNTLLMRPVGNPTMDSELKRSWYITRWEGANRNLIVFEDRQRVVDMWREEGVRCFQTQPGDF
ncbi:hypothetical protein LCGC14_2767970, partial [marine sediment metagenome]